MTSVVDELFAAEVVPGPLLTAVASVVCAGFMLATSILATLLASAPGFAHNEHVSTSA